MGSTIAFQARSNPTLIYNRAMPRAFRAAVIAAFVAAGCAGGSSSDDTIPPLATNPPIASTVDTSSGTTTTTAAPSTTIADHAILADVETAYLRAFRVGTEVLRDPGNPANEALLEEHYTDNAIDTPLENLRLTRDGNYIATENAANPTFAAVVEPPQFVDGGRTVARLTVCEFNSDRIVEIEAAPDGSDALVRDDPISILFVVRMRHTDTGWKVDSGTRGEQIRDEIEQCSDT